MSATLGTLLVIDVQQAFDDPSWGARNNCDAESNVARLLAAWRATGAPIVHVRHLNEGAVGRFARQAAGFQPKPQARDLPGERVVTKTVNSAHAYPLRSARLGVCRGPASPAASSSSSTGSPMTTPVAST